MAERGKTIQCHQCEDNACLARYPQGMPEYCQAERFLDLVQESKRQYLEPEDSRFHLTAAKVRKGWGL